MQRFNSSLSFNQEDTRHAESEFLWYRIDITQLTKQSKDDTVKIEVKEYHKRRRTPFPSSLDIKSD